MNKVQRFTFDVAPAMNSALDQILTKCPKGWHILPVSPENLEELNSAATTPLVVSGEHGDKTIFGTAWNNGRQRVWHDGIHLALQADTSTAGELRVARQQCLELERIAGATLAYILWCDIRGQTLYLDATGGFPDDQASFVYRYYHTGILL